MEFGGTLQLSVLPGYVPALGESFFLVENDGTDAIAGAFSNAPHGGFLSANGFTFAVSYTGDADTGLLIGGNDLVLTAIPTIPEPDTALLGGVGILILFRRRHRAVSQRSTRAR